VCLSPGSELFPQKLVDKVQSGVFVDIKELLGDNIALSNWRVSTSPPCCPGTMKPRLREVGPLALWLYCFYGYAALLCPPSSIGVEGLRHGLYTGGLAGTLDGWMQLKAYSANMPEGTRSYPHWHCMHCISCWNIYGSLATDTRGHKCLLHDPFHGRGCPLTTWPRLELELHSTRSISGTGPMLPARNHPSVDANKLVVTGSAWTPGGPAT
jgi:hypothetical protein